VNVDSVLFSYNKDMNADSVLLIKQIRKY